MIEKFFRKQMARHFCGRGNHRWDYFTWGNALVDNLDDTFGFWDIASRQCPNCHKAEYKLKDGWAGLKGRLFITDLV